jgi:hypothetical protein
MPWVNDANITTTNEWRRQIVSFAPFNQLKMRSNYSWHYYSIHSIPDYHYANLIDIPAATPLFRPIKYPPKLIQNLGGCLFEQTFVAGGELSLKNSSISLYSAKSPPLAFPLWGGGLTTKGLWRTR